MKKVVLITGASSGIGKAIGEFLLNKGIIVYGTSRDPSNYSKSAFPLLQLDVSDKDTIQNSVNEIIEKEGRVDVLINNAGKGITGAIEETPIEEIKKVFNTNFFGVINVCQAVMPFMRKQNNGLIINVTSIAGDMGLPYRGIYSASKKALSIVTETLRLEAKQFEINVIDVLPGDFATNIAAGRYHTPLNKDSAYYNHYSKVLHQIDEEVDEGMDPKIMAESIFKIINNKNPKSTYRIGILLQKMASTIKFILPTKIFEKILMKQYEM